MRKLKLRDVKNLAQGHKAAIKHRLFESEVNGFMANLMHTTAFS